MFELKKRPTRFRVRGWVIASSAVLGLAATLLVVALNPHGHGATIAKPRGMVHNVGGGVQSSTAVPDVGDVTAGLIAELNRHNFALAPVASTENVALSEAQAEKVAISNTPWSAPVITGATLVRATNPTPKVADATAWLFSFDPASISVAAVGGGPQVGDESDAAKPPLENTFAIALVDANSGDVLRIMNGYDPTYTSG